ncbi:putative peptidylprolyl isomerase [Helianthus annuus]|nr:putative peptidylprolyl isomerase [Helianthus annuus]
MMFGRLPKYLASQIIPLVVLVPEIPLDATLIFEVELVACWPRKGSSVASALDERVRLDELKRQREMAAAQKEEEKTKCEEAKAVVLLVF